MFSCGCPGLGAFSSFVLFFHYIPWFFLFFFGSLAQIVLSSLSVHQRWRSIFLFCTWPLHLLTGTLKGEFYVFVLRSAVFSQKAKTQCGLV